MESSQAKPSRPRESLEILFDHELTDTPGKSIVGVQIKYLPNGFTPPHRHGRATVIGIIQEGEVLSGMNGNPPKVYNPGESFIELPGCHHTVGENYSMENNARLMAIFVIDTEVLKTQGYAALTQFD
ncbi:RmlC-like jelly roll fold protein [Pochonia chlamydosporia 170]|uniref:RmlC-like jelly roll fold protein n=1 Tax=Pochonia chlamydosporia 170 TaxID=1380566 RepID=A0A179FHW8_METCM|nr:RmlC-like jelly roll fold protein [Pochonia chlamydosporia 170]OAQ65225.1 RmlC-like jelly roll fold protein [Pochonia chlamydosporia 170]